MENKIGITESDLSKVKENALNKEQLNFLFAKTPGEHTYQRPAKGGGKWTYVTGTYVKKCLNLVFGWDWDFEIIEHEYSLEFKQAIVKGRLTVRSQGKRIVKMQFGRQDIKFRKDDPKMPLDLGNDLKGATTDSLKKCASELGIASDIYAPNEYKEISIIEEKDWDKITYASDLLRTSAYDDDTQEVLKIKINNASMTELDEMIANLKESQGETKNPGQQEIREMVEDAVIDEKK